MPRREGHTTSQATGLSNDLDSPWTEDRYSRQRLIPSWRQDRIAQAGIVVAGAGALGNEVLKNLALLGVGRILIIDFDCVELSNLSRSLLFREHHVGQPKASVAAEAVRQLNPDISVRAIDGDLESDLGLGLLREYDIVLGCLDSIYARWVLNRACYRAERPWLNAGINASVGEVSLHVPGQGGCYECAMTQPMWQHIHSRRSCTLVAKTLPPRVIPTTAIIASLTAALQVNEALAYLHGTTIYGGTPHETATYETVGDEGGTSGPTVMETKQLLAGEMLILSLAPYSLSRCAAAARQDCLAHEIYVPSIFLDVRPSDITVRELLESITDARSLQLDFDLLTGWMCSECGEERECRRLSRVPSEEGLCGQCGALRSPTFIHEISASDELAGRSLEAVGVPPRAILRVKTQSGRRCVELTRDTRDEDPGRRSMIGES